MPLSSPYPPRGTCQASGRNTRFHPARRSHGWSAGGQPGGI